MIQVTAQMRILVAIEPVDFRKGIDGLVGICKRKIASDPFSGYVFVFCNRKKTAIKVLSYDGQGFWLAQKRLSVGRFKCWPESETGVKQLNAYELQMLLWNQELKKADESGMWKKIPA
jgi:transposase